MSIKAGFYKARGIAGSEQFSIAKTGSAQVAFDLNVFADDGVDAVRATRFTTVLSFGGEAGPYAVDRLKACGWDGADILKLTGIDKNEVDVEIFYEPFEGRQRIKCEIRPGGGTFRLGNPMRDDERDAFRRDVRAMMGNTVKR